MTVVLCPPSRLQELTVKEGGGQDAAVTAAEERSLAVTVGEVKPVGPQEKAPQARLQETVSGLSRDRAGKGVSSEADAHLGKVQTTTEKSSRAPSPTSAPGPPPARPAPEATRPRPRPLRRLRALCLQSPIRCQMCPVPSPVHREPICCECQAKFGGYLPVPRAKAVLPYWVPLSLRPQNQIQKMVQSYIPKTAKACPCPCHRFGGHLPMPRGQAVMPYWVPQVLRSHKKVVKRQQNFKGVPAPLDVRSRYNCWRICGEGHHLLKWQQLQALHQAGPVASGQPESPPASLLPLNLSLLTVLHALLRVMEAIR
ncbi:uncharacterized protein C16orf95 homolog [Capricornis sumatraensis]|uniref:uncharacterized protein C16orf95 homolog n=1 Tax=Capricornis sumatraensis TaxID=34865 RepID=UPI0036044E27